MEVHFLDWEWMDFRYKSEMPLNKFMMCTQTYVKCVHCVSTSRLKRSELLHFGPRKESDDPPQHSPVSRLHSHTPTHTHTLTLHASTPHLHRLLSCQHKNDPPPPQAKKTPQCIGRVDRGVGEQDREEGRRACFSSQGEERDHPRWIATACLHQPPSPPFAARPWRRTPPSCSLIRGPSSQPHPFPRMLKSCH